MTGEASGMWWRAGDRSLLIGGVLLLLIFAYGSYELWFVPTGQGYLSSEGGAPLSEAEKMREFVRSVVMLPIQHAVLAVMVFILQTPFLLVPELRKRLEPLSRGE